MRVKWISVKERLPEYDEEVLIIRLNREDVVIGYRSSTDSEGEHYCYSYTLGFLTGVTHWTELPSPPAQERRRK